MIVIVTVCIVYDNLCYESIMSMVFRVSTNETTMSIEFGSPDRCIYKRFVLV